MDESVMLCIKKCIKALEARLEERIDTKLGGPIELKKELAALRREVRRLTKFAKFPTT